MVAALFLLCTSICKYTTAMTQDLCDPKLPYKMHNTLACFFLSPYSLAHHSLWKTTVKPMNASITVLSQGYSANKMVT